MATATALCALLLACTHVQVEPLPAPVSPEKVCIWRNSKVLVDDFLEVLRQGFQRHGIETEVHIGDPYDRCRYVVTYTALRSWDLVPFLSHAEIYLAEDREVVAKAVYHLRGKGGYSLLKYRGTRYKIDPVIDELLAGR